MTTETEIRKRYGVYSLGVDLIDDDHFAMITLSESAAEEHDKSTLLSIFDSLIKLMDEHIEREDALMLDIGFPFTTFHGKLHDELHAKVKEAYKYVRDGSQSSFNKYNPVAALTLVLLYHFDTYDRQFVEYYHKKYPRR